ncbi:MAG: mechanosensitive ion channel protein MscS [Gemmatales bacterium]|nr:MAG: mechanosensitive ion channel protein MscS [Gemmatales bacterium]
MVPLIQAWKEEPLHGAGVVSAVITIILVALLMPKGQRRLIRGPILALVLHFLFLGFHVLLPPEESDIPFKFISLFFLLCVLARGLFLLAVNSVIARHFFQPWPKILLDLIQAIVFAIVLIATLSAAGVESTSLVTGSALVTAAIGLSLRDSLGNLVAGLAIQAERPFEVGDWIQFDQRPDNIGKVLEINWRATKVLTLDRIVVVVPNSQLAQAPIRNFDQPEKVSRRSVFFVAPYDVPTRRVQQIVLDAIRDAWGVLRQPPASVVTNDFNERGVEYWLRYFISDLERRDLIDGGVRDRIWYALHRHGITIPGPIRQVHLQHINRETEAQEEEKLYFERRRALGYVDFLADLPDDALDQLAAAAQRRFYASGEIIIREGEGGNDLFILHSGEVSVSVLDENGQQVELGRLGEHDFFGEMSLMTGAKRSATVTATKDCEVFVIDKFALAPLLESLPHLAEHISETLADRLRDRQKKIEAQQRIAPPSIPDRRYLLQRIKDFFAINQET